MNKKTITLTLLTFLFILINHPLVVSASSSISTLFVPDSLISILASFPIQENTLNLFGFQVALSETPLFLSTLLIAFVDGFNPCSLWVLTFLLSFVVSTKSRKRVLLVGLTFIVVTVFVYGIFILGLISVFSYVSYLLWIRILVAIVATVFALINIKDYFWFKKGLSFTISDKYKPKIFKQARQLRSENMSDISLIFGSAVMAVGIALVELPCTAGFPMVWTSLVSANPINQSTFTLLFIVYLLVYMLDELAVFFLAVFTMKISKFEEKQGRFLKLFGGLIMLGLALMLVINPVFLNDISGTIALFALALLLSFMIHFMHSFLSKKHQ